MTANDTEAKRIRGVAVCWQGCGLGGVSGSGFFFKL